MTGLAAGLLAAVLAAGAWADEIVMRASVRLPEGADAVRLHHIAQLEGAAAEALAEVVIAELPRGSKPMTLQIRSVREALNEAGVHWGHVNLSGRAVVVRPPAGGARSGPGAMKAAAIDGAEVEDSMQSVRGDEILAASIVNEPTLTGVLARYLTDRLALPADRLRIAFEHDSKAQPAAQTSDYRFEIKPEGSLRSDRVVFSVRFWRNNAIERTERITVRPTLLTPTAAPVRDIARGEMVTERSISVTNEWLKPSVANGLCPAGECAGRIASTNLKAGAPIKRKHVHREQVIERGDRVVVRCLVGGVVISLQAEARSDGSVGDTVELRKPGERTTFTATVTGPGEAVVDLSRSGRSVSADS